MKIYYSFLLAFFCISNASAETYKIRWVLAHEPTRVFERAANEFAKVVAEKSKGKMAVEIVKSDDKNKAFSPTEAFSLVQSGKVEMGQNYTSALGKHNKLLWTLDLPFLFRDHDHAAKVLDGEIGQKLLAGLEKASVKGLAFTYSGGYRIIPSSDKAIKSVADFKGLKVGVAEFSPIARTYIKALGGKTVNLNTNDFSTFETTFARLEGLPDQPATYINETFHSLFLTTVIVNKNFFDKLPAEFQQILTESARELAAKERKDSLADGELVKQKYIKEKGSKIVSLDPAELDKMRKIAKGIYPQFYKYLDRKIIADIEAN